VHLDAAPVIYTVEEVSPYAPAVDTLLSASEVVQVASDLTRLECRIKPLRNGDAALLKDYDDYFHEAVAEIVILLREVIDHAAEIRAKYGFRRLCTKSDGCTKTRDSAQKVARSVYRENYVHLSEMPIALPIRGAPHALGTPPLPFPSAKISSHRACVQT
jgi:hypothetical protein